MTKIFTNRIVKLIGGFLTIIALFFLFKSIWDQREYLSAVNLLTILKIIGAGSLAYLIANVILAVAWNRLLSWFSEDRLGLGKSIRIYGRSQVLKYIPGNLVSIPGRHVLGLLHGAENGPLIGAAVFEIIGLLAASSSIAIVGIISSRENHIASSLYIGSAVFFLSLASPLILRYLLAHPAIANRILMFKSVSRGNYRDLIGTWLLYLGFFMITGLILSGIIMALSRGRDAVPYSAAISIFATSWFLGTITPGPPAGVGIRESVLILLLSGYVGEQTSILISLLMRTITMLGDLVFYVGSISYREKSFEVTQGR